MESYGMLGVFLSFALVQGYSITSTNTSSVSKQACGRRMHMNTDINNVDKTVVYVSDGVSIWDCFFNDCNQSDVMSPEILLQRLHGVYMESYPDRTMENFLNFIEFAESNLKRYEPFLDVQAMRLTQSVQTFYEKIRRSKISASMANTLLGIIIVDAKDMLTSQDCRDSAPRPTGVWYVSVESMAPFKVLCNMEVDNGNWTVIQQRLDGSVAFNRTWKEYKDGFGTVDKDKEFWLGNDKIHALTTSHNYELRVDISDWEGKSWYAIYDKFRMEDEALKYKLTIGSYSGTAGDSLSWHNGMFFTTLDNDNDYHTGNCAKIDGGGWWYNICDRANLNGLYPEGSGENGIEWTKARPRYSMKYSRMMIRRK